MSNHSSSQGRRQERRGPLAGPALPGTGIPAARARSLSRARRAAAELAAHRRRLLDLADAALSHPPQRPREAERASSRSEAERREHRNLTLCDRSEDEGQSYLIPLRSERSRSIYGYFPKPPLVGPTTSLIPATPSSCASSPWAGPPLALRAPSPPPCPPSMPGRGRAARRFPVVMSQAARERRTCALCSR